MKTVDFIDRCKELHDPTNQYTRCWLSIGHNSDHRRYSDPEKPAIEWSVSTEMSLVERIKEALS